MTSGPSSIACDWYSFRHEYGHEVEPLNAGRVLRIDRHGAIEWESESWDAIRCPSSDTSIRIKCDGRKLYGSGNIGRFQQADNLLGLTVDQCTERWREVLSRLRYFRADLTGFGQRENAGKINERGTFLTRLDLAGNCEVSDYPALCNHAMVRRISQKLPMLGKFGPTWGYDAKRSNWWRAKIYDKAAELAGKRRGASRETLARFEVQLGSQYLKRYELDDAQRWNEDRNMGQVIYGRFAAPVFKEQVMGQDWTDIPIKLRQYAILWRDGVDIRSQVSIATYYRVRKALLDHGIDIGAPCNVIALTRPVREVQIRWVPALREAV